VAAAAAAAAAMAKVVAAIYMAKAAAAVTVAKAMVVMVAKVAVDMEEATTTAYNSTGIEYMKVKHRCTNCEGLDQSAYDIGSHNFDTCNNQAEAMQGCSAWQCQARTA
jgi:hypothetical protein